VADKEKTVEAMVYVVNLSRVYWGRKTNRADRAVKYVERFVARHTKADKVWISNQVNNYIWERSREKPPRRIKILVILEEEKGEEEEEEKKTVAKVYLAKEKYKPGKVTITVRAKEE